MEGTQIIMKWKLEIKVEALRVSIVGLNVISLYFIEIGKEW
jgi:hypothetical protein